MTHLETLVRILPRQRRRLRAQRLAAFWQLAIGLLIVAVQSIRHSVTGYEGWDVTGLIIGGALLLIGGFRVAIADLLYDSATALEQDVILALEDDDEVEILISSSIPPDDVQAQVTDMIRRETNRHA